MTVDMNVTRELLLHAAVVRSGVGYATASNCRDDDTVSIPSLDRFFFFTSRRRHTRYGRDWSSDVCSSDLPPTTTPTASPAAVAQLPASNRSDPAVVGPMTTPPGDSLLHKLNANALLILVEGLIFIVAGLILLNRISARRQAAKRQREQREQLVTFRRMIAEQLKRNYQPQTVAQQSSGAEGAITRQAARLISTGVKQRGAVLVSTIIPK